LYTYQKALNIHYLTGMHVLYTLRILHLQNLVSTRIGCTATATATYYIHS
jgi:hypothetical protein